MGRIKPKRHKPIRTPVIRGEADYYIGKLFLNGVSSRIGKHLWRLGFRAGVKAARAAMDGDT